MIEAYTNLTTGLSVLTDARINFENVEFRRCNCMNNIRSSQTFNLSTPGVYLVIFNASASAATTAGNIQVEITANDNALPASLSQASSTATTDIVNITSTALVRVGMSCNVCDNAVSVSVINSGIDALYYNASIIIKKIY